MLASPCGTIKQPTGDITVFNFIGVIVFKFNQTTRPTAITQGFPFSLGQLF
jgi:hypothetical protein